ncbi:MAG TPA: MBL fold metallo-hydrolase [Candidatus Limnocylindria bacterium]|nr:MBL fold metallo-hydrolase [Candidatus Limnocylindria bacterium]
MSDRVRYLGHATVLLEMGDHAILTDPVLTERVLFIRRVTSELPAAPDSPAAVLISHAHQDHLHLPSMKLLARDLPVVVPVGLGRLVQGWGFASVTELAVDAEIGFGPITVRAVPAIHSGTRPPSGPHAEAIGFLVSGGGRTVYFAGDTDLFDGMDDLGERGIDLALLPVWGWGPRLGPGHLNPERAAEAVARLRPTVAIPIHWGTLWPVGMRWRRHRLSEPPIQLAEAVRRRNLPSRVVILPPGDALDLPAPRDGVA